MDQCVADVTDVPGAKAGDEVVLIGAQGGLRQSADDVAAYAETNAHDILAGLSVRLPRVYLGEK
jgi:alanine racemase